MYIYILISDETKRMATGANTSHTNMYKRKIRPSTHAVLAAHNFRRAGAALRYATAVQQHLHCIPGTQQQHSKPTNGDKNCAPLPHLYYCTCTTAALHKHLPFVLLRHTVSVPLCFIPSTQPSEKVPFPPPPARLVSCFHGAEQSHTSEIFYRLPAHITALANSTSLATSSPSLRTHAPQDSSHSANHRNFCPRPFPPPSRPRHPRPCNIPQPSAMLNRTPVAARSRSRPCCRRRSSIWPRRRH